LFSPTPLPRAELRQRLRRQRRGLDPRTRRRHSNAVARRLARHPLFLRSQRIAAYWAADAELDPAPLLERARRRFKQCFLPVLRPHPEHKLWFVRHTPGEALSRNRFGIPEPGLRQHRIVLPWALDTILVPLVGFDAACRRLGMGGGFYDRTLAYLRQRSHWRRPALIGLGYECQRVSELPSAPWDIPLDLVVTERHTYLRPRRPAEAPAVD
jgi:5-formyltetrahydrofolate cyclo-ligase